MLLSVTSTTQITHSNFLDESRHNLCLLTNHFFDNVKPCPISTHRFEYRRVTTCVISLITYMFHKNTLWLAGTLLEVCNFQGSGNQIVISDSRIFIHKFSICSSSFIQSSFFSLLQLLFRYYQALLTPKLLHTQEEASILIFYPTSFLSAHSV